MIDWAEIFLDGSNIRASKDVLLKTRKIGHYYKGHFIFHRC
ncbi:hypothetical protein XBJ2_210049 [Xenorhabdus bovienii str. Jollieti]|nr:hypothetical protein XBJ2_210049 [Xenorhabdus bovienii str. Jollieti]